MSETVGIALGRLGITPWGPPGPKVSAEARRIFDLPIIRRPPQALDAQQGGRTMKPETLREVLHEQLGLDASVGKSRWWNVLAPLLDATVYRSCPECGGSQGVNREWQGDYPCRTCEKDSTTCGGFQHGSQALCSEYSRPACADSPTAIVEVALRERAIREAYAKSTEGYKQPDAWDDLDEMEREAFYNILDTALSVVLPGGVRWAKEVFTFGDKIHANVCNGFEVRNHTGGRMTVAFIEEEPHGSKEE